MIKLSRVVRDELSLQFHPGSLVWAKVPGHADPAWPGVVMDVKIIMEVGTDPEHSDRKIETHSQKYKVKFFATDDWAYLMPTMDTTDTH